MAIRDNELIEHANSRVQEVPIRMRDGRISKHELAHYTRSDRATDPYLGTVLFDVNTAHPSQDCTLANDIFRRGGPAFDKPLC